jgi:hypothetical protein
VCVCDHGGALSRRLPCPFEKMRCLEAAAKALHACVEELGSSTRTPSMCDDFDDTSRAAPPRARVAALSSDDMLPLMCLCIIRCTDAAAGGGAGSRSARSGGGGGGAGSGSSTSDRGSESASRSGVGSGGGVSSLVPHWRANVLYLESCTSPSDSFMKRCGCARARARQRRVLFPSGGGGGVISCVCVCVCVIVAAPQVLFCAACGSCALPERCPARDGYRGGGARGCEGGRACAPAGCDPGHHEHVFVRSAACGWRRHG